MDIQTLLFFREVAKYGSFSAAAHHMRYAQSNISTKISQLESDLNTTLFYRNNRGVALTHKGELLLKYAEDMLSLMEETEKAIRDDGIANGNLNIGSLDTIAQTSLPALLASYHESNPEVQLSVTTANSSVLTASVLDRSVDAAFISGAVNHPDLVLLPYQTEHMIFVSSKQTSKSICWDTLENKTFLVFQEGCFYRSLLKLLLNENHVFPSRIIEYNSIGAIISSLYAGIGYALLPESIIDSFTKSRGLTIINAPEKYSTVQTYMIYRKDYYMSTAFSNFVKLVQ